MHLLTSIEFHLLKVTEIALSQYERANGAKISERFLVLKVQFNFKIPSGIETSPVDSVYQIGLMLSERRQYKSS